MTLAGLAIRNLGRNKLRAGLTVSGVAVAVVGFLLLRTFMWAWVAGSRVAPRDRIVTRNKVTFAMPLPKRYVEVVAKTEHVKATTWMSGFGGKDPRHPDALFGSVAVDPATFFVVYSDMQVPDDELRAFEQDRHGAIVGSAIAKKLGWALGDEVILQSGFFPGAWQFRIDGIYTAMTKSVNASNFISRWDYLNDALPPQRGDRDTVGLIVSRTDDPSRSAAVGAAIDRLFESGEIPTVSEDERSVVATFLATYSAILSAANVVSIVILLILVLVVGNTIAMGVRERVAEYGVLRALGFLPHHLAMWIVGESLGLAVAGGVLGAFVSWPLIDLVVRPIIDDRVGDFLPYFQLDAKLALLGPVLAAALGAMAAGIPAWRASKLVVVDAVRRVA
jgi:putative ABC transport system permease protein